jgi:hypothetical protein
MVIQICPLVGLGSRRRVAGMLGVDDEKPAGAPTHQLITVYGDPFLQLSLVQSLLQLRHELLLPFDSRSPIIPDCKMPKHPGKSPNMVELLMRANDVVDATDAPVP